MQHARGPGRPAHGDASCAAHRAGFRPHRAAHPAGAQAQQSLAEGQRGVGDRDLEPCGDRGHHAQLRGTRATRRQAKRVLHLSRGWRQAGVLEGGLGSPTAEGTPPGGPLSPRGSHLGRDARDKERARRGPRVVRDADASQIEVRSRRAGARVMKRITRFRTRPRPLVGNDAHSAVARPGGAAATGWSRDATPRPPAPASATGGEAGPEAAADVDAAYPRPTAGDAGSAGAPRPARRARRRWLVSTPLGGGRV